ncbi:hypothetical protein [uncultured Clostridium sp.]|uniref:hypothetical protein n=1 Tax=uncultured Clostridium sp. TaxID=59620 RepID=UPI0025DD7FE8|nr:hypothetical protein [uncultured Clostridium sp.]
MKKEEVIEILNDHDWLNKEIDLYNNMKLVIEIENKDLILKLFENNKLLKTRKKKIQELSSTGLEWRINDIIVREREYLDGCYNYWLNKNIKNDFLKKCIKQIMKIDILFNNEILEDKINYYYIDLINQYGEIKKKQDKKDNDKILFEDDDYILIQKGAVEI